MPPSKQQQQQEPANSWTEWSQHVLSELLRLNQTAIQIDEKLRTLENKQSKLTGALRCDEHNKRLDKQDETMIKLRTDTDEKIAKVRTEIATLKVKSGVWGAIGAAVPITIAIAIWAITKLLAQ